jgi:hypothetical protein
MCVHARRRRGTIVTVENPRPVAGHRCDDVRSRVNSSDPIVCDIGEKKITCRVRDEIQGPEGCCGCRPTVT